MERQTISTRWVVFFVVPPLPIGSAAGYSLDIPVDVGSPEYTQLLEILLFSRFRCPHFMKHSLMQKKCSLPDVKF
jgi:hypothetical protein